MPRYRLVPTVNQEAALRDHCAHARFVWNLQAMANYFGGTHNRPSWRKAGRDEGFRVVAVKPEHVRRLSRRTSEVWIPKAGWIRFRWSRGVPAGVKSYRVTMDRAGRWHVAFAAVPAPIPAPGNGEVVGIDRGVAVSAALSTGELLQAPGLTVRERGLLALRLEDKAPGRVEKIPAAYTSQTCSGCGHRHSESRESQSRFRCRACGLTVNADVNAARNIAAGHAVTARGGDGITRPVNREPQLLLQSA